MVGRQEEVRPHVAGQRCPTSPIARANQREAVPSPLALTLHSVGAKPTTSPERLQPRGSRHWKGGYRWGPGAELVDDGGPRAACHAVRVAILAWAHVSLLTVVVAVWWLRDTGRPLGDRGGRPRVSAGAGARGVADGRRGWREPGPGHPRVGVAVRLVRDDPRHCAGWGLITGVLELALASRAPDRASRWLLATARSLFIASWQVWC